MATLTIRNLDDELKARLRVRAARHGRSMEEELRTILRTTLGAESTTGRALVDDIRALVRSGGGVELPVPARRSRRKPPAFG